MREPKRTGKMEEVSYDGTFSKAIYYLMAGAIVLIATSFITLSYVVRDRNSDSAGPVTHASAWNDPQSSRYEVIERLEYAIKPNGHLRFETPNREQDLHFQFDASGFIMARRSQDPDWSMRFELSSIGRNGDLLVPNGSPGMRSNGSELRVDHGEFVMRYTNDRNGMRQDFLVNKRPIGDAALEVHMHIEGPLVARNDGPDAIEFMRASDKRGEHEVEFRYDGLKAWDSEGKFLPARMWANADDLIIVVDDQEAVYPITIDPLSSTANATVEMNVAGATFGSSVSTAGDVNGDGFSDLLIGAPEFDPGGGAAGAVFLFLGSSAGISITPDWTWYGDQPGAHAGYSVATAGDVNGDGYSDVLIGSPDRTNGQTAEGRVMLFLGSAAGLPAVPSWSVESDQPDARMGVSIATAGDVNGDDLSDILIGAPHFDQGQTDEGVVYVFLGNATALASTPSLILQRDQAGASFGASISSAGDVNGDGFSDIVIGAPLYDNTLADEGAIFIYHGSATGPGTIPAASRFRAAAGARLGHSVSFAGDVNGDGYSDVLAGSPLFNGTLPQQGQALLYRGSATGIAASPSWSHNGGQANAQAGSSVSGPGDLNGDGYSDVAIGLPRYTNGQATEGLVRVFRGAPTASGLSLSANWSFEGQQIGAELGAKVAPAGDVNGDGIADLVIGAPFYDNGQINEGVALLFHGSTAVPSATASWNIEGNSVDAGLGGSVSSAGDVNGDGFSDVLVGAPMFSNGQIREGRVSLYLGSTTGLSAVPSWTAESDQAEARFGFSARSAGDVNGDGYGDVIIGSPYYSNGQTQEGRSFIYHGSPSGLSTIPAWTFESDQANARSGWSVSTVGDVNGDGFSDVIVGAYMYTATLTAEGRCYVFLGSATGLSSTPDWMMDGGQMNGFFGISVGLAGDVNGDGYDDAIIGATLYDNVFSTEGAAFIVHGSAIGLENTISWSAFGGSGSPQLGNSAGYAGDVNGDGYSDVFVAVSRAGNGQANEGLVRIYHGAPGGLAAAPSLVLENDQANAQFGSSVAHAGDVNGDGYGDLLVGAPFSSWFYVNEGRAFLYLGSPSGLASAAAWNVAGGQSNAGLGTSVSGAGDVNGDGFADVLIGSPSYTNGQANEGRATLHYGNGGPGITRRTRQYRSDLSTPVQTSNNTFDAGCAWGLGQFARSPAGRGKLRLATEIKGHGPPFSGVPITSGMGINMEDPGWFNSGLSGLELTQMVATIPGSTSHPTWRTRVRYHPATSINGQMFGSWYHAGIHDAQVPSLKVDLGACGPLPIELIDLSGYCIDAHNEIRWSTGSESGNVEYRILFSLDGKEWEHAATIPAAGNSLTTTYYTWRDGQIRPGSTYYQLRSVPLSGDEMVEAMIHVNPCPDVPSDLQIFPNPAIGDLVHIIWSGPTAATLIIKNVMGDMVAEVMCTGDGNGSRALLNAAALAPGTYFVIPVDPAGNFLSSKKLVIVGSDD